jgi:hypothetical protein
MSSIPPWRHADEISHVQGAERVAIVTLSRLEDPPVVLTGTAASIWAAVDGARDDEAVACEVAARYDVPVEEIRTEVLTFLQHLASCQLISRT